MPTSPSGKVPVTIISGFLGAGKTTLINNLLQADHGLNITVLVNDFGAINIDAELILRREREVMELSNGCVCCSIQNDLVAQLQKMFLSDRSLEYLLIEASGVSQPGRIAAVFGYPQLRAHARVDAVVTLLDAANAGDLSADSRRLVETQLEAANIAVLTKTDLVSAEQAQGIRDAFLFPGLPVYEADHGGVPVEMLLDTGLADGKEICQHSHSAEFASAAWQSATPKSYSHFKTVLQALPASVYRAKGVLYCSDYPDERIVVHKTGTRLEFRNSGPWSGTPGSQLVVIGLKTELKDKLLAEILQDLEKKQTCRESYRLNSP